MTASIPCRKPFCSKRNIQEITSVSRNQQKTEKGFILLSAELLVQLDKLGAETARQNAEFEDGWRFISMQKIGSELFVLTQNRYDAAGGRTAAFQRGHIRAARIYNRPGGHDWPWSLRGWAAAPWRQSNHFLPLRLKRQKKRRFWYGRSSALQTRRSRSGKRTPVSSSIRQISQRLPSFAGCLARRFQAYFISGDCGKHARCWLLCADDPEL